MNTLHTNDCVSKQADASHIDQLLNIQKSTQNLYTKMPKVVLISTWNITSELLEMHDSDHTNWPGHSANVISLLHHSLGCKKITMIINNDDD